jgi:alkaline phosphatase
MKYAIKILPLSFLFIIFSCITSVQKENTLPKPKNIIIFIGDGMGYNHVLASNYYEYGEANSQIYEQEDWVKYAMATYNAVVDFKNGDTVYSSGYNPQKAWIDADYVMDKYTDSGAGGTAISSGKKTYDSSIGIGIYGDTLVLISNYAKKLGKSVGIVTAVPISHATPASFVAHNASRKKYEEIAKYLIFNSVADVIMGAGNPSFNNSGDSANSIAKYVGGFELWNQLLENDKRTEFYLKGDTLQVNDINDDGKPNPWTLIQTREEFNALIENPVNERILGVAQVFSALNSYRRKQPDEKDPFDAPLNQNIPTLKEMTLAALSVLNLNENGFFIMVEGGAIDWASHDNISNRMIEEQVDFNNSIRAAVEWIEKYSSWEETLVIVTADHECGYLTGPSHPAIVNSPVKNNGKGKLPNMKWNSTSHTNQLVPFYAKGPGANLFEIYADEFDPKRGAYIQNTEIAQLIYLMWIEANRK